MCGKQLTVNYQLDIIARTANSNSELRNEHQFSVQVNYVCDQLNFALGSSGSPLEEVPAVQPTFWVEKRMTENAEKQQIDQTILFMKASLEGGD